MKKASIIIATILLTVALWIQQRQQHRNAQTTNRQLTLQVTQLTSQIESKKSELATRMKVPEALEKQLKTLQAKHQELVRESEEESTSLNAPEPDPNSLGGWPEGTDYLFLSKQYLTNANYQLLAGDRLTNEAARLLGMTPKERQSIDQTFTDLLGRFGQLEIESMQKVEPPSTWDINSLIDTDSYLVYEIPDLNKSMTDERTWFNDQVSETLGSSRAAILKEAADAYIRQNLDSLGSGQRTIGFFWEPNSEGRHDIWYAISGDQFGPGSFTRINEDYDRESQMAYYARLFGVKLPTE